jgi:hypothetical protein
MSPNSVPEVKEIKSFKKIFFDKQFDFELETYESEDVPFYIINDSVIAWLEQKLDSLPNRLEYYHSNEPEQMQTCGKIKLLKELIKELKDDNDE